MAWYTPATWRELRAIPEAKIEMSYPQFVRKVERMIAGFEARGLRVVKVPINVTQMVEWCHRHGYEADTTGRAAFWQRTDDRPGSWPGRHDDAVRGPHHAIGAVTCNRRSPSSAT